MKKRITEGFIVSFLLVLSLFFTSCSHLNVQAEDLIGNPSLSGFSERVMLAVNEFCGEDTVLVYPTDGKNSNPIIFNDMNNDGKDEIIVLFRNDSGGAANSNLVNVKIFTDDGESLYPMFDIQGGWYDIGKIEIADIDGDEVSELVVGYQNLDIDNRLSVYSFDFQSQTVSKLRDDQYTDWVVTDINNDGIDDVVLIYINDIQNSALAIAYKPGCGEGENTLDYTALGTGGEFYKMTVARDSFGSNYIIVSSKYGTLLSSTEILSWDPLRLTFDNISYSLGKTQNPFLSVESSYDDQELDTFLADISDLIQSPVENLFYNFCSYGRYVPDDVDSDGLVEFPMCYEFDEASLQYTLSIGKEKRRYRYSWYRYETDSDKIMSSYVYRSIYHNYTFIIDDKWDFERVFVIESSDDVCNFYYVPQNINVDVYGASESSVLLFRIRGSASEVEMSENVLFLDSFRGMNYYAEINPDLSDEAKAILPSKDVLKEALVFEYKPKLINTFDSYISDYHNYIFVINENWDFDNVYVFERYNRDLVFYYVEDPEYLYTENPKMKIPIFTIKTSSEEVEDDEFTVNLECINNIYYYIEINPDLSGSLRNVIPSEEELKEAFIPAMISAS